jgi:hypothetical protein
MNKMIPVFFYIFILCSVSFTQQNDFYIRLSQKEIATFNDAITLMRIIYDEKEDKDIFIENVLWAAGKKLFQVTIPISPDKINPLITRKEFAYWCCQIYNLKQEKVRTQTSRYSAYKLCVDLGIMSPGRGPDDSFSGQELLDTFSYLIYYIKYKKISPNEGVVGIVTTTGEYDYLPEWRKVIYRELDEQRAAEKKKNDDYWKNLKKKKETTKKEREINEKFIDTSGDKK